MKKVAVFVAVLTAATVFCDDGSSKRPQITTAQIGSSEVLGALGQPLGTCFQIRATVMLDDSNRKGYDGTYYLTVSEVEGEKLSEPVDMQFFVHRFATKRVKIARDDLGLYLIRNGKSAGSLSKDDIAQLRKGYVGTTVKLVAYQTVGFSGIPRQLPGGVKPWQGKGYGLEESLIVMDQEELGSQERKPATGSIRK